MLKSFLSSRVQVLKLAVDLACLQLHDLKGNHEPFGARARLVMKIYRRKEFVKEAHLSERLPFTQIAEFRRNALRTGFCWELFRRNSTLSLKPMTWWKSSCFHPYFCTRQDCIRVFHNREKLE